MKRIVRLTENDLVKLVKKVILEQNGDYPYIDQAPPGVPTLQGKIDMEKVGRELGMDFINNQLYFRGKNNGEIELTLGPKIVQDESTYRLFVSNPNSNQELSKKLVNGSGTTMNMENGKTLVWQGYFKMSNLENIKKEIKTIKDLL
jgi:hypothetical protein